MKKDLVDQLIQKAEVVREKFSNPNREYGEVFQISKIQFLSEHSAAVVYNKPNKKLALAFFYWVECKEGYWTYFFPKESHVLGLNKVEAKLDEINEHNLKVDMGVID